MLRLYLTRSPVEMFHSATPDANVSPATNRPLARRLQQFATGQKRTNIPIAQKLMTCPPLLFRARAGSHRLQMPTLLGEALSRGYQIFLDTEQCWRNRNLSSLQDRHRVACDILLSIWSAAAELRKVLLLSMADASGDVRWIPQRAGHVANLWSGDLTRSLQSLGWYVVGSAVALKVWLTGQSNKFQRPLFCSLLPVNFAITTWCNPDKRERALACQAGCQNSCQVSFLSAVAPTD